MLLFSQLETMIPENIFSALSNGVFLSIIAFSLMFGVCTIWVGGKSAQIISEFFDAAVSRDDAADDGDHRTGTDRRFLLDAFGHGHPRGRRVPYAGLVHADRSLCLARACDVDSAGYFALCGETKTLGIRQGDEPRVAYGV